MLYAVFLLFDCIIVTKKADFFHGQSMEGVLNSDTGASEALSGEAPRTLFAEGVLNPNKRSGKKAFPAASRRESTS